MLAANSGSHSLPSSGSIALCESLANKCRQRFDLVGLTEYNQIWLRKVTPSGLSYWEHTARGRRTSDSEFTGWPTCRANDGTGSKRPEGRQGGDSLKLVAEMSGWPSPSADGSAGEISEDLERRGNKWFNRKTGRMVQSNLATDARMLAGWVSPTAQDGSRGSLPPRPQDTGIPLSQQVVGAGWATPRAEDSESTGAHRGVADTLTSQARTSGPITTSSPAGTENSGALAPDFAGWLMGYPIEWIVAGTRAMLRLKRQKKKA